MQPEIQLKRENPFKVKRFESFELYNLSFSILFAPNGHHFACGGQKRNKEIKTCNNIEHAIAKTIANPNDVRHSTLGADDIWLSRCRKRYQISVGVKNQGC